MARFRLKAKHYLNVPGTEWEHKENPQGGKLMRKIYKVPRYIDPDDPADHNYVDNGEGMVIVSTKEDDNFPKDIVFIGDPTPDMDPIDKEAKAIFARFKPIWDNTHPIESLPSSFGEAIMDKMMGEIEDIRAGMATQSQPNVSVKEIEDLRSMVATQQQQITHLIGLLQPTNAKPPEVPNSRRV